MNVLTTLFVTNWLFAPEIQSFPGEALQLQFTRGIAWLIGLMGSYVIICWLIYQLAKNSRSIRGNPVMRVIGMISYYLSLLVLLSVAAIGLYMTVLSIVGIGWSDTTVSSTASEIGDVARTLHLDFLFALNWIPGPLVPLWLGLFVVSYYLRKLIVQYVGDVVAYINSAHVDRFYEIRTAIKETATTLLTALYKANDENGAIYDAVFVIGHSLGSVVAYDALNASINLEKLQCGKDSYWSSDDRSVAQRTPLFLTFGSPLDKTAYLFTVLSNGTGCIRERLATAKQPLIDDATYLESIKWVNVYSRTDVVAGILDNYGECKTEKACCYRSEHPSTTGNTASMPPVTNVEDEESWVPYIAHIQYWDSGVIFRVIKEHVQALVPTLVPQVSGREATTTNEEGTSTSRIPVQ